MKEIKKFCGKIVKVTVLDPTEYHNDNKKACDMMLADLVVIGSLDYLDEERIVVCSAWYENADVSGLSTHALPVATIKNLEALS